MTHSVHYSNERITRVTKSGATFYTFWERENFGKDTAYARSWRCFPSRRCGRIWAKPGESFYDAVTRRAREYENE